MAKVNQKINIIFQSIPLIRKYPSDRVWIDYDREADVLYINFEKLQRATESILKGNVLIRKRNGKIVGITILNASKFKRNKKAPNSHLTFGAYEERTN
jgi:uncharacterized protein YuzE